MGDIEIAVCDFCHKEKPVERTYLKPSKFVKPNLFEEYDLLYNQGKYFIIISTCNDCGIPKID